MCNNPNSVSFWSKGDLLDLAFEYNLLESSRDANEWATVTTFDDLAEFVCYLMCGGYGESRNIHAIEYEEMRNDARVIELFKYCDAHCY